MYFSVFICILFALQSNPDLSIHTQFFDNGTIAGRNRHIHSQ